VAIAHDYLNQRGGAERVVVELAAIWPQAPVYTSLYRPDSANPDFRQLDVRTSVLDRVPVDRGFRALAPLYPLAFRSLGALSQELVVSSSSGWAHAVRTAPESLHVVYCHTPARWLYATRDYVGDRARRHLVSPLLGPFRRWDRSAAHRADRYIANTQLVRDRIRDVYGLDADVVYPPVDTKRFTPRPRGDRLLVISRLLPYKRVDLAVLAASRSGLGLDVVGDGPELGRLKSLAGPTVEFHGRVGDGAVTELIEGCSALCVPGAEDFGIVAIEALAAGKPVIAFARGGVLETLDDGVSAALFRRPDVDAVLDAITRCDRIATGPEGLAAIADRYSKAAFADQLRAAVQRAHERRLPAAGDGDR
jgi:glycosyltransferase involved in cell wall biosynthesis